MVQKIHVEGYDAYKAEAAKHTGKTVFVLFSGSLDAEGKSWCPDCVTADPVIEEGLKSAPEDAIFIHCSVGERAFWKDNSNIFKTDPELKLIGVPTLIKLGTKQRLVDECGKIDLVKMMFEDE